ncbi:MAG: helix-turn-helix domain-containing protein [Candidatus Fermentibacterota bacterium]
MTFTLTTRRPDLPPEPARTSRNPIIFARELKAELEAEGLNQTELANRMGVTRARISQWLSLLGLPSDLIADIESLCDHWTRRLVTERQLRKLKNAGVHGLKRSQHHTDAYSCRLTDIH